MLCDWCIIMNKYLNLLFPILWKQFNSSFSPQVDFGFTNVLQFIIMLYAGCVHVINYVFSYF